MEKKIVERMKELKSRMREQEERIGRLKRELEERKREQLKKDLEYAKEKEGWERRMKNLEERVRDLEGQPKEDKMTGWGSEDGSSWGDWSSCKEDWESEKEEGECEKNRTKSEVRKVERKGPEEIIKKYKNKVIIIRRGHKWKKDVAIEEWVKEEVGVNCMVENVKNSRDIANLV